MSKSLLAAGRLSAARILAANALVIACRPPRRMAPNTKDTSFLNIRTVPIVVVALGVLLAATPAAGASQPAGPAPVDVIEVNGRLDAIEADFIERSIESSERAGSQLLVVQLDSPGTTLSNGALTDLAERMRRSAVPVGVWVGPSGSRAYGESVRLLPAAATAGMATGTHIGRYEGPCPECPTDDPLTSGRSLNADEALALGVVDSVTPTLGDFIVSQDGRQLAGRLVTTARVIERDGQPRREPVVQVRFAKLNLVEQVLHATTNPSIAYLLLAIGLLLVLFEFYSVGIGVAGLTGAVSFVLAAHGLAALDASALGLAVLGLAMFGYAVDVQAGVPRVWTAIGTVAFVLGSVWLFPSEHRVSWLVIVLMLAGTLLFVLRAMPTMVRARFSTAVIGRNTMIGETGAATTAIAGDGTVRLRGGLWRARTIRAAPIAPGDTVRVVAIDGLVLEVEPDEGTA